MSLYSIQGYVYTAEARDRLARTGVLDLNVGDYQPLSIRAYLLMRKSLMLYERLEKARFDGGGGGAKLRKPSAGQRWITVHPNGKDDKGVPVLIQEDGNGTAHVVGGAGGRLNMLKLNNIKSPAEYKEAARKKREEEQARKEEERKRKEIERAGLTEPERKKLREQEKAQREAVKTAEEEKRSAIREAEDQFIDSMRELSGWEDKTDEINEEWTQRREQVVVKLQSAIDGGDKEEAKALKKELSVIDKAHEAALKSQRSAMFTAAREAVREIQKEAIEDETIKRALEERIGGSTEASEVIKESRQSTGKGFASEFRQSAEAKGELTEEQLASEKNRLFQENLDRIAREISPQTAMMIERGVETRRAIGEIKRELFERERLEAKVTDLDAKAEALKKYLSMKKTLKKLQGEEDTPVKAVQLTIDGEKIDPEDEAEKTRNLVYGDGLTIGDEISVEDFTRSLDQEAARIEAERQAAVNGSLLERIKANPNGPEKWIANGHYDGFNQAALTVLKAEALSRDVVDVLGLRASSQLLAKVMRDSLGKEDFDDSLEAIERFHAATNEQRVTEATEAADLLLDKAGSLLSEIERIKVENPDDLAALNELNETRLSYLDEANRILGQTLGSLEASAALASSMKTGAALESIDTNLGPISAGDAVVRLRALGLTDEDYQIESINGDRIATIGQSGIEKLAKAVDPEAIALERDIEDIKRGAYDEADWLPDGVVNRPLESFEDPGVNPDIDPGEIDNQGLADDAATFKGTQEAAHRALGEIPEGAFAFKQVEDLSPQEQNDLRRYWETNLYKGSTAERLSVRDYQGKKGKTKAGVWQSFLSEHGEDEAAAYEAIRADLIANHSEEDMFGMKDPPPITKVRPDDVTSFKGRVNGSAELFGEIEDLERDLAEGRITESAGLVEREIAQKKAELPEKLKALYQEQLRDHYHKWMSGVSETEYEAGATADRFEGSPWAEYVRMHGDVTRAQAAVLDTIKGQFLERFADSYARVNKRALATKAEKIAGHQSHVLGMLGKEERDAIVNKVQSELASAGASVANRAGGKFASGSWRDKAIELMQQRRSTSSKQSSLFGEEDVKQNDGSERVSIGKRAEEQLASMLPELSQNLRRGERFNVSAGMSMQGKHAQQQRAIKMFERTKRMNLTFGTGKGKSITSIGAFTHLKGKGAAKRAVFAVPSVVQSQFGGEVNRYLEPGKYRAVADPTLSREQRIEALKNPKNDMVVFTHQSLRDDLVYLMAGRMGLDEEAAKEKFNAMSPEQRKTYLGETLRENGIALDMLTVDESHYTVNRKGKEDSTTSNVLDALNQNVPYFLNQSATPIKNDASEAFDFLRKVDPKRFTDRDEFLKRYGVDSEFSRESLRRLIARYNYSSPTETGVRANRNRDLIQLTAEQRQAYDEVTDAFRRASRANRAGQVDIEAMRVLSPNSFKGKPPEEHEAIARRLQTAAGTIKEEALNRVVNQFDPDGNAKIRRLGEIVDAKRYQADHPRTASKAGDHAPGVIFAHNLKTVDAIRSALEKKGLRVGMIHGAMTGQEKDRVKTGFNPANPSERQYDVIVLSDAGATGLNLQNAKYLVNFDLPQTSWVKEQREGRIDRHGQAHDEIDYHDLVTDTEHEDTKLKRVERKKKLGAVFQQDPGAMDDTGLAAFLSAVRQERRNAGADGRAA